MKTKPISLLKKILLKFKIKYKLNFPLKIYLKSKWNINLILINKVIIIRVKLYINLKITSGSMYNKK